MDKDILTTADTARLLGVSVRTAQLLIEGGSVPSWKTPGGHRRVYRADVEALIESRPREEPAPSAAVAVLASPERAPLWRELFRDVAECAAEIYDQPHAALLAIGAAPPHAVAVDLLGGEPGRMELLESLAASPALGGARLVAVGARTCAAPNRVTAAATPQEAIALIRDSVVQAGPGAPEEGLPFPVALNEAQRLVALERLGLVDTPPEDAFDRLTWLAARNLDAPISLVTLLTPTRQWFKSRLGLDMPETPRSWAFCNHTILQKEVFSVEDLQADSRFAENPAVAGAPGFRFYAGAPILDETGLAVGSLCVIDYRPRTLEPQQAQALQALAAMGSAEVRLRAAERRLRTVSRSGRPARS